MLVTRSVHESMKSDLLQQLSCHLHSSRIPLPWPLLCVYAEKLTKQPSNPSRHSCFRLGGHCRLAFALALALPFVFIYGADLVTPEAKMSWMVQRWMRLFMTGFAALLIFVSL